MPYCSRCGVELAREAEKCPLCHSPLQKFPDDPPGGRIFPEDELATPKPKLSLKERLKLAAVTTGFAMLIPILITITVDSILNGKLSWSLYPLIIISASLLIVLTALYSYKKPGNLIWMDGIILSIMIYLMTGLYLLPPDSVKIILPLIFVLASCSHGVVRLCRKFKKKGANIGAVILAAVGLCCFLTELWLSLVIREKISFNWSLIVLAATQPVTLLLFYLHYKKNKGSERLKKYFHL